MHETSEKILQVAAQVFAAKGFQRATVREICRLANVNLAALNYHFRDKSSLYQSVLRTSLGAALLRFPPDLDLPANASPEDQLRAFIRSFILRTLDDSRAGHYGRLLAREISDPSPAFEQVLQDALLPLAHRLESILAKLISPAEAPLFAASILSQCFFFHQSRAWLPRVLPGIPHDDAERLAEHVSRFSLAALRR